MWQILNLTKTHGRATLNVPVISSESLDRIAKHGTTISRMKTKVNIGKLVELGGEKDSCRPRWKVGNSLRNKILAQVRHVSVKKKKKNEKTSGFQSVHKKVLSRSLAQVEGWGSHSTSTLKLCTSGQVLFELQYQQHPPSMKVLPREHFVFRQNQHLCAQNPYPKARGELYSWPPGEEPICLPSGSLDSIN